MIAGATNSRANTKQTLVDEGEIELPFPNKLIGTAKEYIAADVVLLSACQDDQETAGIDNVRKLRLSFVPEGTKGGACTSLFLQIMYHQFKQRKEYERKIQAGEVNHPALCPWVPMTYGKVLTHMQRVCERNHYDQIPHLSSSRPLRIHEDPFLIVPKNRSKSVRQRKRALIIGINYTGTPYELPECHNDCHNIISFLKRVHNFEDSHITVLMDNPMTCDEQHQPTKKNLLRTFRNFAMHSREGDVVFLHFAGHGVLVADESGDEISGFDEALLPVDYMTAGEIIDDDIFRLLLIPMPQNVTVTALFDCCHSGTILDLPFEYTLKNAETDYDRVRFPHMHLVQDYKKRMMKAKNVSEGGGCVSIPEEACLAPKRGCRDRLESSTRSPLRKSKSLVPSSTLLPSPVKVKYDDAGGKPRSEEGACISIRKEASLAPKRGCRGRLESSTRSPLQKSKSSVLSSTRLPSPVMGKDDNERGKAGSDGGACISIREETSLASKRGCRGRLESSTRSPLRKSKSLVPSSTLLPSPIKGKDDYERGKPRSDGGVCVSIPEETSLAPKRGCRTRLESPTRSPLQKSKSLVPFVTLLPSPVKVKDDYEGDKPRRHRRSRKNADTTVVVCENQNVCSPAITSKKKKAAISSGQRPPPPLKTKESPEQNRNKPNTPQLSPTSRKNATPLPVQNNPSSSGMNKTVTKAKGKRNTQVATPPPSPQHKRIPKSRLSPSGERVVQSPSPMKGSKLNVLSRNNHDEVKSLTPRRRLESPKSPKRGRHATLLLASPRSKTPPPRLFRTLAL